MDHPAPPFLTVIVPAYNEAASLPELHARLYTVLAGLDRPAEIIFVDDGSTDGSFAVIAGLAERDSRVRGVQLRRNWGKSAALAVGFARAAGEVIVTLDADLQDDPAGIPHLLARLDEGYDLVCGWRRERADPWTKRAASRIFNAATRALSGLPLHDFNSGLRACRRAVVEDVRLYGDLHRYLPVLAARQGFRVTELPVAHHARRFGRSKYGLGRVFGAFDLLTVLFLNRYTARPLHLFGVPGLLCFAVGAAISAWLAWGRLFERQYLSNRPLLFLGILLLVIGVQFVSLGLLGEMITAGHSDKLRYSVAAEVGRR